MDILQLLIIIISNRVFENSDILYAHGFGSRINKGLRPN